MIQAIAWKQNHLEILDQTCLPEATVFRPLRLVEEVIEAIQQLRVRGAPAIGITAAYGLHLGLREHSFNTREEFFQRLAEVTERLVSARPTAVNLAWALGEIRRKLEALSALGVEDLRHRLLELAIDLHEDDRRRCQRIAEHGQSLVPEGARVLTHCNTGALATGGLGTALGIVHQARATGKKLEVYVTETRPVLQGARLTMWELHAARIPAQLLCDGAAAALMAQRKVDLVLVGADRIAADGSVANKIGTYSLAVLARHHGIPFHVAAPLSTFDLSLPDGRMPIEVRNEEEIRRVFNRCLITLPDAVCWNPAFDVTPPELVTALVTERGILHPPFAKSIRAAMASGEALPT